MVSLKYHSRDAEVCVAITASSIDAIHAFHTSKYHQSTDRYSSVIYLAGAIIPLTCVIIKEDNEIQGELRARASSSFQKALSLLQEISPGHTFAKRMLSRLRRIVDAANRNISTRGLLIDDESGTQRDETWMKGSFGLDVEGVSPYQFNGGLGGMLDDTFSGSAWDGDQFWPVFEMETFDAML